MDAASEIKEKLNIEDVVGEYVQLKRAGRNYKGLSPFGNEKTPSFMVSPDKGIWHDFSSGKGGSIFGFIMEVEGVDFRGALEILARKAGVELKSFQGGDSKRKEKALAALALAKNYYQHCLVSSPTALEYVKNRGISRQTLIDFGFGYSPGEGHRLADYLASKGVDVNTMQDTGLITKRTGSPFDMFRGRLMIPLSDAMGQTVGFTARQIIEDNDSPKYINTPATLLYDKGRQVFGLAQAKEAIRKSGFVVIVEGNLDVTTSHQVGVQNVVAAAGTALTANHLKSLSRYSSDLRICFDNDTAGQNATERAVLMAIASQIKLSVIEIGNAKDPDELIQKDASLWSGAVAGHAIYGMDWLIDRYAKTYDLDSADGKKQFSSLALKAITSLDDAVEREHYQQVVASRLGTSLTAVQQKMYDQPNDIKRLRQSKVRDESSKVAPINDDGPDNETFTESAFLDRMLSILVADPSLREDILLNLDPDELTINEQTRFVIKYLRAHPDKVIDSEKIPKSLQEYATYVKILLFHYELRYKQMSTDERREEAHALQRRILKSVKGQQKDILINRLRAAERAQDKPEIERLLKQIQQNIHN